MICASAVICCWPGGIFFVDTKPEDLAHKVLSVNLSDMAAMGAVPKWVLLSVALPVLDKDWLKSFAIVFMHFVMNMAFL